MKVQKHLDLMVMSNVKLVVSIINKKYPSIREDPEVLLSYGCMGLRQAALRFDPSKGYRFSTYCWYWIRQSLTRYLYSSDLIRKPIHVKEKISKLKRYVKEFKAKEGRAPTKQEIADHFDIDRDKVDLLISNSLSTVSLNQTANNTDSLDELIDLIADNRVLLPAEELEVQHMHENIQEALDILTPREKDFILKKFGFHGEVYSLQQIADESYPRVSRERCRQVISKALNKLRQNYDVHHNLKSWVGSL